MDQNWRMVNLLDFLLVGFTLGAAAGTVLLPYSETQDVGYTLSAPDRVGCYRWSTDNDDVLELIPVSFNSSLQCGHILDVKIVPGTANMNARTNIKIIAEDVREGIEERKPNIEFSLAVAPISRLQIEGKKTNFHVNDPASEFKLVAFDKEGARFDTLDGIKLMWLIGSSRDIADFESNQNSAEVDIVPTRSGKGTLFVVLEDSFYKNVKSPTLDIRVKSPLIVEPDGPYIMPGGEIEISLFENIGTKQEPKLEILELKGESAEYRISVKNEKVAKIDQERGVIVGIEPGEETTILVHDAEGTIVKGAPIRVTSPHSMKIVSHPFPHSKQLIINRVYNITVKIYDENEQEIYPSNNILTKTTFGKQFEVKQVSENGLWAIVETLAVGVGQIRASLRSTIGADDEESEITPHIKAVSEFRIYEDILMTPDMTKLPWDPNHKENHDYQLTYKATGGGQTFKYHVEPEDLARVSADGKVKILGGPGIINVTTGMASSMHNNFTAKIFIMEVLDIEILNSTSEGHINTEMMIPIAAYGGHPTTGEKILYDDCSDLEFQVKLSNSKDFSYQGKSYRGDSTEYGGCAFLRIVGSKTANTILTVSFLNSNGTTLKSSKQFSAYKSLEFVEPMRRNGEKFNVILALGTSRRVVLSGGPLPWVGKPSSFYTLAGAEDESVGRVVLTTTQPAQDYYVLEATCLSLGETIGFLTVGNKPSFTNSKPALQNRVFNLICTEPAKISQIRATVPRKGGSTYNGGVVDEETGRINLYSHRDIQLDFIVKDAEGRSIENITSLNIEFKVSDTTKLKCLEPCSGIQLPKPSEHLSSIFIPSKPAQIFSPQGLKGDVDIEISIKEYRESVLNSVGAKLPRSFGHPVSSNGEEDEYLEISETIELTLTTDAKVEAVAENLKSI
ncbi:nuclear pore membrane glycoprotein 210 [Eurytemora carolleeae]|uniref:nuclear pore membrane glycoprotein 210 n=1 Tax=Eurytemora carolleeae TaxID=1294199 RepID=UPI000C7830E9|nr:nuclear pore membrane glycoprotein 210 [Eurytemora carolleeae]|eukprot:XP_023322530.1 nuclear pore membrane glycoprotein 210-like [Eurytemora affinis]